MKTTTPNNLEKPIDTVMAEVHRVKEELAKRFNYDLSAMLRDARARQGSSGHRVVDLSKKD